MPISQYHKATLNSRFPTYAPKIHGLDSQKAWLMISMYSSFKTVFLERFFFFFAFLMALSSESNGKGGLCMSSVDSVL